MDRPAACKIVFEISTRMFLLFASSPKWITNQGCTKSSPCFFFLGLPALRRWEGDDGIHRSQWCSCKLDDVPISLEIDFHFLLGFAIDADSSANPQNGKFSPYWASSLTPDSVASIKMLQPNVKGLASLSGWSLRGKTLSWYNPQNPEQWISNAFSSLSSLTTTYHLDGIDIDYEVFPRNEATFAYCIGELITMLKNQSIITVATIAPYYSTIGHYIELFEHYADVIDYVNHQFYTDRVKKPKGYLEAFKLRASQFAAEKLLPSYEVNERGIQGDLFLEALELLESHGFDVGGVMILSADDSSSNGYYYERKSQAFLLNSTSSWLCTEMWVVSFSW